MTIIDDMLPLVLFDLVQVSENVKDELYWSYSDTLSHCAPRTHMINTCIPTQVCKKYY